MMTKKLYSLFFVAVALVCVAPVSAGKAAIARKALAEFQPYAHKMRELAGPHTRQAEELIMHAAEMLARKYVQKGLTRAVSGKLSKKRAPQQEAITENDISTLLAHVQEIHKTTEMQTLRVKKLNDQSKAIINHHE